MRVCMYITLQYGDLHRLMYVCACVCTCTYVHVYVCICMHTSYACVCMCMYMYVCVCTCTYAHVHVCTCMHTPIQYGEIFIVLCMCLYMYVCACTCVHMYVHTNSMRRFSSSYAWHMCGDFDRHMYVICVFTYQFNAEIFIIVHLLLLRRRLGDL